MEKVTRENAKILDDIKSAGQIFLAMNMEDLLNRVAELDDIEKKTALIGEYWKKQNGFYDKNSGGTRTRVNSALRIIRADKVLYALKEIVDNHDPRVEQTAIEKANELIKKIESGEIRLPRLE